MLWVCKVNYKIKAVERTYFHVIWIIRARSDFVGPKDKKSPPQKKASFNWGGLLFHLFEIENNLIVNLPTHGSTTPSVTAYYSGYF